jgi:hypothetical protein
VSSQTKRSEFTQQLFDMFGFAACRTVDKRSSLNSLKGKFLPSPALTEWEWGIEWVRRGGCGVSGLFFNLCPYKTGIRTEASIFT